ncbi:MAG: hypothetical protein ABTQ25_00145 [Nitrosomonas ureae]
MQVTINNTTAVSASSVEALYANIAELAKDGNTAAAEIMDYIASTEQKRNEKVVLFIDSPNKDEIVSYTKKDLGYFFWTLLDDLYMAEGMDFIQKVIGEGGRVPSNKVQKILAERFLHAFSFEGSN